MSNQHRERKQAIRSFMVAHYTDERLAQLLAHAKDGKLIFTSCCCFIGVANADHALETSNRSEICLSGQDHYARATRLNGADEAEYAYRYLGETHLGEYTSDDVRRRILIPIIKAEFRRRDRQRAAERVAPTPADLQVLTASLAEEHAIASGAEARDV